jgi:hypothetical protein
MTPSHEAADGCTFTSLVGTSGNVLTLVKARPSALNYPFCVSEDQGEFMSTPEPISDGSTEKIERVPTMQRILDNPFLLLFLGVTLPTVLYIIWGVMEIASVPLAK